MKKFLSLSYIIFIGIIAVFLIVIFTLLSNKRAVEQSAITIAQISQIRSALSVYMAQRGEYPHGQRIILGGQDAAGLCLVEVPGNADGFMKGDGECPGTILENFQALILRQQHFYTSAGSDYAISFVLQKPFGAFPKAGPYCATDHGILVGQCQ